MVRKVDPSLQIMREVYAPNLSNGTVQVTPQHFHYLIQKGVIIEYQTPPYTMIVHI